jgi:hypothetical protein
MILISHRGNLSGRLESRENKIDYIEEAIDLGFDVEIDVWFVEGSFFLGHDTPETPIDFSWFEKRKENLWIHAKNAQALEELMKTDLHYFFHENDLATITSKGFVWVYPGNQPIRNSIAVLPELLDDHVFQCSGVCSDFILNYKKT